MEEDLKINEGFWYWHNNYSYYMTSSMSAQDGAILPAQDAVFVLQGKFIMFWCFIPYNKSFIDQPWSVNMAGYWPRSFFFCMFMDLNFVSVHKHAKKELGQYPAVFTSCFAWPMETQNLLCFKLKAGVNTMCDMNGLQGLYFLGEFCDFLENTVSSE